VNINQQRRVRQAVGKLNGECRLVADFVEEG
jgi:hypothetical protein